MQDSRYTEWFRFVSQNLPEDTFHVVRFTGTEGLNTLFSFTIDLVSSNVAVDTAALLSVPATFTILREDAPDAVFSGYPARVEQGGYFNGYAYYTVELRPAFWKLTQVVQSSIFLNQDIQDVTRSLLSGQQFFLIPYEFRLMRNYPSPEFSMQYEESVYNYILWRMEEQGAYFYFSPKGDTVIFADTPQSHDASSATLFYSPTTGLENNKREEVISSFSLAQTPLPHQVIVRSYDWKNPRKVVVGTAEVSATGMGDVYLTNENVESDAEAERIASIRAEELICRSRIFTGTGSVPTLRPGVVFTLNRHYNPAFNRDYLVTSITHEGGQEAFLSLGLGIPMHGAKDHLFYHNTFSCIESDVPYRPERKAPRAKVSGVIRAFVDGAGSGARAEIDEYGRYKLLFPFDISQRKNGNASCWIRMAQPHVGKDSGMSLPLLPGVEVIVSFIDGNPDRPVITGALPNGETGTITGSGNNNFSGIRTPGGNQITINDTDTHQGISLLSASGNGLTMTSGSLDSSTSTTDTSLSTASIASAEVASICKSTATGYKVSQSASCGKSGMELALSLLPKILSSSGKIMDSLSEKFSSRSEYEGLKWGAEGSKLAGVIISMGSDLKSAISNSPDDYGVIVNSSSKKASTKLQVFPSRGELLGYVVTWLVSRIATFGLDTANTGLKISGSTNAHAKNKYLSCMETCMDDLISADENTYKGSYDKDQGEIRKNYKTVPCAYYSDISSDMSKIISEEQKKYSTILKKLTQDQNELSAKKAAFENATDDKDNKKKEFIESIKRCMDDIMEVDAGTYANKYNSDKDTGIGSIRGKVDTDPSGCFEEVNNDMSSVISAVPKPYLDRIAKWKTDKTNLDTQWNVYCNDTETNKKYYTCAKQDAIRKLAISNLSTLLPELTATIVLLINHSKTPTDVGGISLTAEKNINLNAKTAISQHSDQGILLHTGPVAEYNETMQAGSPMTMDELVNEIHSASQVKNGSKDVDKWGIKGISGDFMAKDINTFFQNEGAPFTTIAPGGTPYLAFCAPLQYSKADNKADLADNHFFYDNTFVARSGSKASTLTMTRDKIALENPMDNAVVRVSVNSDYGAKHTNTIGLSIEKEFISLNHKENSLVYLDDDWAAMKAKDSQVFLTKDTMAITGKTISIAGEDDISIKGNKVEVAGVVMQKGKIQGSNSGVLEIGGAIKVMASQVAASVKDAESSIKNALDKLNERIDALDKKLSSDTTKDSAAKPE